MATLVRCEGCGAPNSAVSTSCSTCGAPRASRAPDAADTRFSGFQPSSYARPNIMMPPPQDGSASAYQQLGNTARSPSTDTYALGSSASARGIPNYVNQQAQQQQQQSRASGARTAASATDEARSSFQPQSHNNRQRNDPSQQMLASMFPLIGAGDDGSYTEGQVQQLLHVIETTQQYGKEIEQSVEELAELLRKKTLECDGLREIARENYDPLRQAVKNEYNSRVKQESRHSQEQRRLQQQIELLKNDRTTLQQELDSLRKLVQELQAAPPPVNFNPGSNTLLNHMLRNHPNPDDFSNTRPTMTAAIGGSADARQSWMLASQSDNAMMVTEQRDFVNYITSLNSDQARALHNSGVLDFIKVLCRRMSTNLPDGTFPDIGVTVGELLRELRSGVDLAAQATQPIPTVSTTWRQRASQLFLANKPSGGSQLALLLEEYRGREEELYNRLRVDFDTAYQPQFDEVESTRGYRGALEAKAGSQGIQATSRNQSVEERELHARCIIMYRKYNPAKATSKEVQDMLRKYPPEVLLAALVEKYGPEPTASERKHLVRSLMEEAERNQTGP